MQQQFIISRQQKALVLNPASPEMLTTLLPMAKPFAFRGQTLYAVPHDVDVVRLLRNVGVPAPSPILTHYDWPCAYPNGPFPAQREAAAFMTLNPRSFNLSQMGCVDATTEYLTPTGWKRIDQYDGGQVGQYHPDTGAVEFVAPTEYVKLPCANMLRIKTTKGLDQLLSEEHRVLLCAYRNPDRQEVVLAQDLYRRQERYVAGERDGRSPGRIAWSVATVPVAFSVPGGSGVPLSDAHLRLQIAVIADGHFPNQSNACVVRVKKPRKVARLKALLAAADTAYSERVIPNDSGREDAGFHIFRFAAPRREKEFTTQWWAATPAQLKIVCEEVICWDGSVPKSPRRGPSYSTTSKLSADFVQYAFVACGHSARISIDPRNYALAEHCYTVQVRPGVTHIGIHGAASDGATRRPITPEPSPDGFKYCFMVPSTFLVFRRNGCVFASGNTGKSLSTLWAFDFLRSIGQRQRMLVVAPLSTLERTWGDEIFKHFPHLKFAVLHGTKERRLKLLAIPHDIYIVNHDGVEVIAPALFKKERGGDLVNLRPDIDVLAIDEIAVLRNSKTARFRAMESVCAPPERTVWGLTGTPIPNEPTDAWAQVRLVDRTKVPPYFGRFRDMTMTKFGPYKWVPKPDALQTVLKAMQPSIRFTREALPDTVYQTRHIELSVEQKRMYEDLRQRMKAESEEGTIRAVHEADKLMKLVQVAAGAVYTTDGETVELDNSPRISEVLDIIEQSEGKTIVFVPFIAALKALRDRIALQYPTELVYGGTSKGDRDTAFWRFQNLPARESAVLVANASAMSHGLTLTEASTIVWVAPTTSHETFDQANHRIIRTGQKRKTLVVMLEGTAIERQIYNRLRQRQSTQGLFLEAVTNTATID